MVHAFHTGLAEVRRYEPRARRARAELIRAVAGRVRGIAPVLGAAMQRSPGRSRRAVCRSG